jgi:hypothetical protein
MSRALPSLLSSADIESRPKAFDSKVLGESIYDRVSSFLMAVVLGALMVVGLLGLIYVTNQAYASRVTSPLQIVEVSGGGGGSPDGTPGSTEKIDVPGADAAAFASNNEETAGDFEEPSVQTAPGAMLDAVADAGRQRQARLQAGHRRAGPGLRARRRRSGPRAALEHRLQHRADPRGICEATRRPGCGTRRC